MSQATPATSGAPTVVLVHGAFADASGWAGVISRLQAEGISVMAPANPLRSVSGDAAYIASVVTQIPGPVLLVGHSYGGAVISNAAPQADNVVGLVYVCAFIPDEGEALQSLAEQATDSLLGPALRPAQYPSGGDEPGIELYIDPAQFHEVFCADLPAEQAAIMAVSQRPGSAVGFGEPSGTGRLEDAALLGADLAQRRDHRSQRGALHGRARRRRHRRGRRLARRHDLPAAGDHRSYPHGPRGCQLIAEAARAVVRSDPGRVANAAVVTQGMTEVRITHIGGPTTLIAVGGWRLLTDPTFDPPGRTYTFGWGTGSRKLVGPAIAVSDLPPIDAVLLTHDHHGDNLDLAGRALLPSAGVVVTTVSGATRLGGGARGLAPWAATRLEALGRPTIEITATPCRHGPPLSHPLAGDVIGFALRWDGQQHGVLWISGDTVLYDGVRHVADRLRVGTALLHLGGVQFPVTGPLRYSMTARDAVSCANSSALAPPSPFTTRAGSTSAKART